MTRIRPIPEVLFEFLERTRGLTNREELMDQMIEIADAVLVGYMRGNNHNQYAALLACIHDIGIDAFNESLLKPLIPRQIDGTGVSIIVQAFLKLKNPARTDEQNRTRRQQEVELYFSPWKDPTK